MRNHTHEQLARFDTMTYAELVALARVGGNRSILRRDAGAMEEAMTVVDSTPATPAIGLHRKLAEVMAEVGRVPKRGRNEFHKYDYATEADIVDAVRGALSSRSISIVPSVRQVLREGTLTTVLMAFQFTDGETGETSTHDWAGTGDDKGDKGLYKAMTGALKYFLLKTFLLPTGDDPEADTETDKRAAGQATGRARGRSAPPAAGLTCTRCSAQAMPGSGLCATCDRLARERRTDDARAAEGAVAPVSAPSPEKPPALNVTQRKRAFALMEKYGIQNDAAHRPDRLAVYGKALALNRLATEDEAKRFTADQWAIVCEWLIANNEPPDDAEPPLGVLDEE